MSDYIFDQKPALEDLTHYGVKGMKWGVRKDRGSTGRERAPNVSRRIDREAGKDAKEFARSKAYYGEGAGTRRKLIKQTVDGKAKRIPGYKDAFDFHLDRQDTSKHASKAVSERKSRDRKDRTSQRAKALARRLTGEQGSQAAIVAVVLSGAAFMKSDKGQQIMKNTSAKVKDFVSSQKQSKNAEWITDYIQRNS